MTEQEWTEWKQHPMTVRLFKYLEQERQKIVNGWAGGHLTSPSIDETVQMNAKGIGAVQCIDELLNIEGVDLEQ